MIALEGTTARHQRSGPKTGGFDTEVLVGYVLLLGVLMSMVLITVGVAWGWLTTGHLGLEYPVSGKNLSEFVLAEVQQISSGAFRPRILVNLGMATLMLTPYVRVFASMLSFALVERNRKYTVFTGFVFAVLTYSLFLR